MHHSPRYESRWNVVGKYDGAINARREQDAQRLMVEAQKAEIAKAKREAEEWKQRADDAVMKAEFAYEVLRAILPDLRRGQPVSKPALTNAWSHLKELPEKFTKVLMPDDNSLDRELRKDDPQRR